MKYLLYIISTLLFISCKGDNSDPNPEGTGNIQVRIWNGSEHSMDEVYVNTSGGEHVYGSVPKGTMTGYRRYESAYRYAFISFKINGESFAIQPIDYVGEVPLKKGSYTYKLTIPNLNSPSATLEFIED